MRLARYIRAGEATVGVAVGDTLVDVASVMRGPAPDVTSILAGGPDLWSTIQHDAELVSDAVQISDVCLLAPVTRPAKFLGVGMNSRDHLEEIAAGTSQRAEGARRRNELLKNAFPNPRFATMFNKQTSCVGGPSDQIWMPRDSELLDYEGEVAMVIGHRARRLDVAAAGEVIAGYTVTNDVSVRDWQTNTSQMWLGKSFETHGPIGPWIVTRDEFDVGAAVIRTWVNDELRQKGRLSDQTLSPSEIVSQVSQVCTLEPGDLIATGTPAGVGAVQGRFLVVGDRVRVAVEGIGQIENVVVPEPG